MTSRVTFSEDIAVRILNGLAQGNGLRALCRDPRLPSRSTVQAWANRRRDIARGVDLGRDNAAWAEADRRVDRLAGRADFQRWLRAASSEDRRR